jgi:hypothetical protein
MYDICMTPSGHELPALLTGWTPTGVESARICFQNRDSG